MSVLKKTPTLPLILWWSSWGLIGLGILLRLRQYTFNKSLWLDEAALILNIINRPLMGLFRPLDINQGAPVGFLLVEKILINFFGQSEYVVRFFPFLCSIVALFIFYRLSKHLLHPYLVPICVLFMAISNRLLYYSTEAKQYSVDVAVALGLLWLMIEIRSHELTARRIIFYSFAGSFAIWLSHPAVFVLAGTGLYFFLFFASKKEWPNLLRLSIIGFAWGFSLLLEYIVSLKDLGKNEALTRYWTNSFAPFPPTNLADLRWYAHTFYAVFKDPLVFPWPILTILLFFVGCIALIKKEKYFILLLASVLPFILVASFLQKYPISDRLILFLVPIFILIIMKGIEFISLISVRWATVPGILLIGVLLVPQLATAKESFVQPTMIEEIRPVMQYVAEQLQPGDQIYVYYGAEYPFEYYSTRYGINQAYHFTGMSSRSDPGKYNSEIDEWMRPGRVWFIFSHIYPGQYGNEMEIIIDHINEFGDPIDSVIAPGSVAYLYDIREENK